METKLRRRVGCVCALLVSAGAFAARLSSPKSGGEVLFEFASPVDMKRFETDDARVSIVQQEKGKVLRVEYGTRSRYPSVRLKPEGRTWDLSAFGYVQAEVTNAGEKGLRAALRIDEQSKAGPSWNAENIRLRPGQDGKLRVWFGRSWGKPGKALDAARIVGLLIYLEKPERDAALLIRRVTAGGRPGGWKGVRPPDGVMLDFGPGFDLSEQAELRDAEAEVIGSPRNRALRVSFGAGALRPTQDARVVSPSNGAGGSRRGVYLRPGGVAWDLRDFTQVEVDLRNTGGAEASLVCRTDNRGAADGRKSSMAQAVVKPGRRATLTMSFGPPGGGRGLVDSDKIVGVLVTAERPTASGEFTVDRVRAAAPLAALPDWLGERPPVPGEWTVTLNEEFDGPELDPKRWTPRLCWNGPHKWALQRYSQDNVYVEDGKMIIKCEKRRGHQYNDPKLPVRDYTTGAVTTLDKWTQRYGYFEARLKAPRALGLWPAFWMMPDRGRGNGNIWQRRSTHRGAMEIDIFEHLTRFGPYRYNIACHWDGYGREHKNWGDSRQYIERTADGFHHAGLLWEPGRLTWYCDGRKMITHESQRVSNAPEFLKFTVEMGGWAGKEVDDGSLPDCFVIDHVRAWQKTEWMDK